MLAALALLLLPAVPGGDAPKAAPAQDAAKLLAQATRKLTSSRTAQWETTFEVVKAPPVAEQGRKWPFRVGKTRYQFRVKGDGRVHWAETWEGKGRVPTRQAWYEGNILYVRSSDAPQRLVPVEVGEGEGNCVKRSLVEGGILGWRLAHHFDAELPGGGYVAAMGVRRVREERLGDRPTVVLEVKIGFGFGPMRPRREAGTTRLWIDKETLLPAKRETTLPLEEGKGKTLQVNETYTNWRLNEPLADKLFHVKGMGRPHPLLDAPRDPAQFEVHQTRKFLGFAVRDFPQPQGPKKFDELPADAPAFAFTVTPRKVSGPDPRDSYQTRNRVVARAPDGGEVEAYCGYDDPKQIVPGHGFESTPETRRHQYGGGAYHPQDVYVGKRVGGRLKAGLFFRDVGSHNTAPHHLAVDGKGRCHLTLADVDLGQGNRFKLYWLVGNLAAGKWTEAWLIDHREHFTSWAHPLSAAWKEQVHLVWDWADVSAGDKAKGTGVYHVQWTPAGFGRKARVFKGLAENLDMAVHPKSGRLVLVFSTEEGVFVASRPAAGPWTRPTRLHPDLVKRHTVSIQPGPDGAFVIRTRYSKTKEWLLTVGAAPKGKRPDGERPPARTDRLGDPLPEGAVARMGSVRLTHEAHCWCVAFSPDGKVLASGSDDGEIGLWEVPTGKEIRRLQAHTWQVSSLAFSPDCKRLASGSRDRTVRVWDVGTGRELHRLRHAGEVNAVAYSPDGKTLASASEDGTIRIWDAASGKHVRQLTAKGEKFRTLALSPQGPSLAAGSWDQPSLSLWQLDRGDKPRRLPGHKGGVHALAFSRDGKLLASAGWDGMIQLSDPDKGAVLRRFGEGLRGPQGEGEVSVTALALSADGKVVASGDHGAVLLWDAATGKRIRRMPAVGLVYSVALSADGRYLASASQDKIELWDVATGAELWPGQGHRDRLYAVAFSPDGKLLATGGYDRAVILWEAATGRLVRRLPHEGQVTSVAFSPDGKTLAAGSRDKTVVLWDPSTGRVRNRLQGPDDEGFGVAFSPDGQVLAIGGGMDGVICLREAATGKVLRRLKGHTGWVGPRAFSPDGKVLASGSVDRTVRLWDVATGEEVRRLTSEEMVNCVAFSSDGNTLAVGCFRGNAIRLWELQTGRERARLAGPSGGTSALRFSRDGKVLAAAGYDGARLFEVATGKERDHFVEGHLGRVYCVALSPDGRRLATGSNDFTALVWDIAGPGSP
jgi:WD40 repeat protein